MSPMISDINSAVCTRTLRGALSKIVHKGMAGRHIESFDRRLSEYGSSFAIEELDVSLNDGSRLELMFKDLSYGSMLADARRARPGFLYDPRREIRTYDVILSGEDLGTARFIGGQIDRARGRYFLFIERVSLPKLCHIGDFNVWQRTASWLAEAHDKLRFIPSRAAKLAHLLEYDGAFYQLWMNRARSFYSNTESPAAARGRAAVQSLSDRYERIVTRIAAIPRTVIHGEFYASNILADASSGQGRVCPVDWELASVGPGLLDLAALVAGTWTDAQRNAMAMAYYDALRNPGMSRDEFSYLLLCCRLHLAVQYMGWATQWSPPSDQKQDWLAEATTLARSLEL